VRTTTACFVGVAVTTAAIEDCVGTAVVAVVAAEDVVRVDVAATLVRTVADAADELVVALRCAATMCVVATDAVTDLTVVVTGVAKVVVAAVLLACVEPALALVAAAAAVGVRSVAAWLVFAADRRAAPAVLPASPCPWNNDVVAPSWVVALTAALVTVPVALAAALSALCASVC